MEKSKIFETVQAIVADKLAIEKSEITMESGFANDLSADSLDFIDCIAECENEFNIIIPDDEQFKIETIGELVNLIETAGLNPKKDFNRPGDVPKLI